jgi:hypothetical protein
VATIENCYSAAAHLATGDKAGDKKNGADNAATKPAQGVFAGMGWDFSGVWRMAADG